MTFLIDLVKSDGLVKHFMAKKAMFSSLLASAATPAPGKVIFEVEQTIQGRFGHPAALQAVRIFLAIL